MLMKSKSQTTTKGAVNRRLPRNRPPTHPGEMLFEEFVKPLDMTQTELASRLGVSYPRLNEIIKGGRSVTPDTALRLSRVLGGWGCLQIFGWVYSRIGIFGML